MGGGPRVVVSTAAFHARVRGSVPGLGGLKETKMFLPHPRVKVSIVGSLRDREVACSASDRQGANFESCVWRTVSSQSSHHPQEVLLAQFSLYVHKGGLKPDSFHFILLCHISVRNCLIYFPWYKFHLIISVSCFCVYMYMYRQMCITILLTPIAIKLFNCYRGCTGWQAPDVVGLLLGQRLRRWPSISPTSGECLVFPAGPVRLWTLPVIY